MSPAAGPRPGAAQRLALWAYGVAMRLLLPAMLLRCLWRGRREPLYRRFLAERWGGGAAPDAVGRLWVHAVSLGETRAAAALVQALREREPGLRVLWTHGTATGRAAGAALLRPGDVQAWLPWDSPGAVRRFLARHRPVVGVLMETEVWPALIAAAGRAGVPMLLANARLSERSLRRGRRVDALLGPAARGLAEALAQGPDDARRLREAGVRQVQVCGQLKYDMTPAPEQLARGRAWRARVGRPVVLAASTREGEEEALLAAWGRAVGGPAAAGAAGAAARPLLVVVPRHPQRFDEVARRIEAAGWRLARRSGWDAQPPPEALAAEVWLGDSLGELASYYAAAEVALLGGSFAPLGGQNLIEAAACGCPLLLGPSTFNFADAADAALEAGAARRVADLDEAVGLACAWAGDPAQREARAAAALRFAAAHRGAARAMADAIVALRAAALAPAPAPASAGRADPR
ncbi:3-deoxy-D-manno-octulosonic acid transferase [Piscinibacter sakaiensis]|uniref:3-deoxy-D-manno-octulosonic acid transferase n=1 Tax=Piscinibacter sakaiensis TaxID=1547922 RepID=A0A0K8P2H3_PISS1|nr:3-deoxy-D-manno-octulosonic acid transferase [Piscinibacter sakaiensis]GAP36818.1 3-deoxy-D-manno-octulosonic-acid transferase [Piscinibacter sakaiensis]